MSQYLPKCSVIVVRETKEERSHPSPAGSACFAMNVLFRTFHYIDDSQTREGERRTAALHVDNSAFFCCCPLVHAPGRDFLLPVGSHVANQPIRTRSSGGARTFFCQVISCFLRELLFHHCVYGIPLLCIMSPVSNVGKFPSLISWGLKINKCGTTGRLQLNTHDIRRVQQVFFSKSQKKRGGPSCLSVCLFRL